MIKIDTRTKESLEITMQELFDHHGWIIPFDPLKIPACEKYLERFEGNLKLDSVELLSRNWGRTLESVAKGKGPEVISASVFDLIASAVVVASVAAGAKKASFDYVLTDDGCKLGTASDDSESLVVIEDCSRMTQEAETRIKGLVKANEEMELAKMELQDTNQALTRQNQQLQTELKAAKQALSVAQAQVQIKPAISQNPIVVEMMTLVQGENQKLRQELGEIWIEANRARVVYQHSLSDRVVVILKAMQGDADMAVLIAKNPLLGASFVAMEELIPAIPA